MNTIDQKSLLALRAQIVEKNAAFGKTLSPEAEGNSSFGAAMTQAIKSVNAQQSTASAAAGAYERGETTDIAAVMLERQKSSIAFEATLQVRNKLLSAYKDIMSMPV
jgi:flagellar hook-basal body complex protein FliE